MPERDPLSAPEQLPLPGADDIALPHAEEEARARAPRPANRARAGAEQPEVRYLLTDPERAEELVTEVLRKEGTPEAWSEDDITRLSWEIRSYALTVMDNEKRAGSAAGKHVTTSDVSREGTRYYALQQLYLKLFETLGARRTRRAE
jgi:hypothetical protein